MAKHKKQKSKLKDYYAVLGVQQSASQRDIQLAFRNLSKACHPDVNPSPEAKERFQELGEAYMTLKAPEKRKKFDARVISDFCNKYLDRFEEEEKPKKKVRTELFRILGKM